MEKQKDGKKGQDKQVYQLKKLLGKKEELGDISKWKNIAPGDMLFLKKLEAELSPNAMERLNSIKEEDRKEGLYSILVANYFSNVASRKGRDDVVEKIGAIFDDTSIKAEEIGMYAFEAVRDSLPDDERLEKLARTYLTDKKVKRQKKEGLEKKLNTIDVVLLPKDLDGECEVYIEYDFKKRLGNPLENTEVNIYSAGRRVDSAVENVLSHISKEIQDLEEGKELKYMSLSVKIISRAAGAKPTTMDSPMILAGGFLEALILGSGGAGIGGAIGGGEGAAIGAALGAIAPTYVFIRPAYQKYKKAMNKKLAKKLDSYNPKEVNWIESKDLNEICDKAEGKIQSFPEKPFEHDVIKRAINKLANKGTIDRKLCSSYKLREEADPELKSKKEKKSIIVDLKSRSYNKDGKDNE
ncbi:MAG: hypothetical protein ABIB71_05455 [Candidatus Woesearchaeota archaeon]